MNKPNYSLKVEFKESDPLNKHLSCFWTLHYNGQLYGNIIKAAEDLELNEDTIKDMFQMVIRNFEDSWKIIDAR